MLPGRWTRWPAADFCVDPVDIMNRGWFILHSSIQDIEKSKTVMLNAVSSSALWWEAHKSPWVAGWIREAGGLQALQESIMVTCRCFSIRRWQHSFSKILTRRLSDDWGFCFGFMLDIRVNSGAHGQMNVNSLTASMILRSIHRT